MKKLLSLPEVAEYLGLAEGTVRIWAWQQRLPIVRIGRRVMVPIDDLEAWVQARKCEVRDVPPKHRRRSRR
jgi:excisionase family DNA binding protein